MHDVSALLEEGVKRHQAGRLEAADAAYLEVLVLEPGHADATHLRGLVAFQRGHLGPALDLVREAIRLNGDVALYHGNLGRIAKTADRLDEAVAAFERSLDLAPDSAAVHADMAAALLGLGATDRALESGRRAVALDPSMANAHYNLGLAFLSLGAREEAANALRRALAIAPDLPGALYQMGRLAHARGDPTEAADYYRRAVAVVPTFAEAHVALALALLEKGRFRDGFAEWEWRWKTKAFAAVGRRFRTPAWDGSGAAGRAILVHADEEPADAIQFVRYAALVAGRGGRVTLVCRKPLKALLKGARGVSRVVAFGESPPRYDAHVPLLALPRLFGTGLATVPARVPYLRASPARLAAWRALLGGGGLKVGLAFAGDEGLSPPARSLAPLLGVASVRYVLLEAGGGARRVAALAEAAISDVSAKVKRPEELAAAIGALDLVIAADGVAAHLAGALGRPALVLLPHAAGWRWLRRRNDSPWYPSLRLFRQRTPGDWDGVVKRVRAALKRLAVTGKKKSRRRAGTAR